MVLHPLLQDSQIHGNLSGGEVELSQQGCIPGDGCTKAHLIGTSTGYAKCRMDCIEHAFTDSALR